MAMQARDASGRKVSLLNDEPSSAHHETVLRPAYSAANHVLSRPYHPAPRSISSSPNTPELMRSDSYDSQTSNDPMSPLTPSSYDYPRTQAYAAGPAIFEEYDAVAKKRPSFAGSSRSNSYEEDGGPTSPAPERPGKRYPCRYRDSHGCEKTFTTSGHASRHSKIHTAEKAVQCTFQGCQKKFTRADNMKQHLETHYKDKSRGSVSHKASGRSSLGSLSSTGRRTSAVKTARREHASSAWEAEHYAYPPSSGTPLPSPGMSSGAWDLRGLNLPLMSRPSAARTPSSGLDALAMAVAVQEGA